MALTPNRIPKAALALTGGAALLALYRALVAATGFMPRCAVKWVTGLSCPGCGSQRAFDALLHGHPLEALRFNLILLPALLYLLLLGAAWTFPASTPLQRLHRRLTSPKVLIVVAAIMVAWMVVRNLLNI